MSGLFHPAQFLRFSDVIVVCSFLLLGSIQMCAYNRFINSQSTDIWIICRWCLLWIRMLWKFINLSLIMCFISLKYRSRTAWSYGKFLFNYFKKLPSSCMTFQSHQKYMWLSVSMYLHQHLLLCDEIKLIFYGKIRKIETYNFSLLFQPPSSHFIGIIPLH